MLEADASAASGAAVRDVAGLRATASTPVWRVPSRRPTARQSSLRSGRAIRIRHFYDWAGGLIWLEASTAARMGWRARSARGGGGRRRPRDAGARQPGAPLRCPAVRAAAGSACRAVGDGSRRSSTRAASSIRGCSARLMYSGGSTSAASPDTKTSCRPTSPSPSSPTRRSRKRRRSCGTACIAASAPRPARPMSTLGNELDSPRGRIYLIKDMLENDRPAIDGGRHPHRPLPVLPLLHDHLPLGRQLHASGRPGPRPYREDLQAAARATG